MQNLNSNLSIVQKLEEATPAQLATIPEVAERFQNIYKIMNGGNEEAAAVKYEAEKFHFMKLLQETPALQQCTKLSLYGCFLDMAVNGLSFDRSMKHAYVVSFNTNVGTKQAPKWEKRATLMISGYGELHMRVRQGQLKHADNPILVYEGDHFQHGTKDGRVFLEHVATFPRKSEQIIACYIRLERADGTVDYKVFGYEEVMKLRQFSKDKDSLAWTAGLPGMIQAKTIKHAFKSYPKIRMGEFSQLQTQTVDESAEVIDYGLGNIPAAAANNQCEQAEPPAPETIESKEAAVTNDDSFAEAKTPQVKQTAVFQDDEF